MTSTRHTTHGRADDRRRGFSLVEVIVVLVNTGIVAAVAIASMAPSQTTRQKVAARQMTRDLNFARERAIASGTGMWVVFGAGSDTYTMLVESTSSPGRAGATAFTDPATGRSFSQRLNANEFGFVDITGATIGTGAEVGFDWRGRPRDSTSTYLTSAGTISITGATVNIEPETGLASWQ